MRLSFFVPGTPRPKGSKRGFPIRRKDGTHGVAMVESSGDNLTTWMRLVRAAAEESYYFPPTIGPVELTVEYWFARPKSHYGTGRNVGVLKASAPAKHITVPDRDKLDRAIGDALEGVIWVNDRQVYRGDSQKCYCKRDGRPGAYVLVKMDGSGIGKAGKGTKCQGR